MYGQMTAGSWIYIGSQGIVQGTYETFGAVARQHFGGSLAGRFVLTAGLGGMGGAQPLAATMHGAAMLGVEVDESRIDKRLATRLLRPQDARSSTRRWRWIARRRAPSDARCPSGWSGTRADVLPELVRRGVMPDVLTDQTSAHDMLQRLRARRACRSTRRAALRAARSRASTSRARTAIGRRARARDARAAASAARSRSTTATTSAPSRSTPA